MLDSAYFSLFFVRERHVRAVVDNESLAPSRSAI